MTKEHLQELAFEVMSEFDARIFPERRLFYLHPRAAEDDVWWVQFICGKCETGYMARLTLSLPPDAADDWIKDQMRAHIKTHLAEEHPGQFA